MFHSKHELGHFHSVSEFDQCALYLNVWTTGCLPGCYFVCLFVFLFHLKNSFFEGKP